MAEIGRDIAKAKQILEAGDLVGIPTETVYGLAGNALNADAVSRPAAKPTWFPTVSWAPPPSTGLPGS